LKVSLKLLQKQNAAGKLMPAALCLFYSRCAPVKEVHILHILQVKHAISSLVWFARRKLFKAGGTTFATYRSTMQLKYVKTLKTIADPGVQSCVLLLMKAAVKYCKKERPVNIHGAFLFNNLFIIS
jgi:hypothetical protein